MAWNFIESLRAASDAAYKGAEAAFGNASFGTYKRADIPVSRRIIEESKRNGFEVDREHLQNDMKQIGRYFDRALEQLGIER